MLLWIVNKYFDLIFD